MRIEEDIKLDFNDVLIRPKRSSLKSRCEVQLKRDYLFKNSNSTWQGIPIIASNMDHIGTFKVAYELAQFDILTAIHKFHTFVDWQEAIEQNPQLKLSCFVSGGSRDDDFKQIKSIVSEFGLDLICLDVANGYSEHFLRYVERVRNIFPNKIIMAGNVVTGEMTEQLILSGTDIVKVGIGCGSVCTTRKKTAIGYPQLSAIIECSDAAHGLCGHVCADGGCRCPADVIKAFAAGADFVMLGGILAGHDECSGEIISKNGKQFKRFYGMSSEEAMNKYRGKMADYRASEGNSVDIAYKGNLKSTILDILGGMRSACTYVGAAKLKELSKRTTFVKVNRITDSQFKKNTTN